MNAHHVKYVLVGGGVASSAAAEAIRQIDRQGAILLIGQEIVRPYHRPPLSKDFLTRQVPRDALFVHGQDWYENHGIQLRTGRRAVQIDAGRSALSLDQGEVVGYDKLLLATGMTPRHLEIPGAQLPNLYYLRTLEDAQHLQTAIEKAKSEGHFHATGARCGAKGKAVVIGAGVLGVELAAALAQSGLMVDLLCGYEHPWKKFAGEVLAKSLTAFMESRGVRVHSSARPLRLEGDGRVQRVAASNGATLDCDFAAAAIGATANRELLRNTPIAAEKAILTDVHGRTSIPNIFAAGDCAAIFDPLFGKHRILDHWDNARITGSLAGRNMAGANEKYQGVNAFFSRVFDLELKGWGEPRLVDRRLVRAIRAANGLPPDVIEFSLAADGSLAQVLALGHQGDEALLEGMVARRQNPGGAEEQWKDPKTPLAALAAER